MSGFVYFAAGVTMTAHILIGLAVAFMALAAVYMAVHAIHHPNGRW